MSALGRSNTYIDYQVDNAIWRDGDTLVINKHAQLPDRCLKCNNPAHGNRLSYKFNWHHPAINLLILFNIVIYWVVMLVTRKTARIDIGLCDSHLAGWRGAILGKRVMVTLGLVGLALGIMNYHPLANVLIGLGFIFAGVIYGNHSGHVATIAKMDDNYLWLEGADESYLNSLPQLTEQGRK